MSTMSSAIAVGLSDYTRTTSPAIFYISAYNFEQVGGECAPFLGGEQGGWLCRVPLDRDALSCLGSGTQLGALASRKGQICVFLVAMIALSLRPYSACPGGSCLGSCLSLSHPLPGPPPHTTHTPAQTLYGDFNRLIDSSDYLGDAAKYIKLYNKLRDTLGTGEGPGAGLHRMRCSVHLDAM